MIGPGKTAVTRLHSQRELTSHDRARVRVGSPGRVYKTPTLYPARPKSRVTRVYPELPGYPSLIRCPSCQFLGSVKSTMEHVVKRAARGRWANGQSGNPKGRPKLGETLADAMRDKFPPSRIAELAERLATEATSEQVRLAALQMIAERTHGKVTTSLDVTARQGEAVEYDFSAMSIDEQRELLGKLEAARVDGSDQRENSGAMGQQPDGVTVDDLPPSRPPCHGGAA